MIAFYAHHHGSGHVHRCRAIMDALELPAQLLSTDPTADVVLPDDAGATGTTGEATANGAWHYVPTGHAGLRERMARLAAWVAEHRPRACYVDVSVEVASLMRLLGVPVVTLAMPGQRDDAPHQLGYRQADAILAAWPDHVPLPAHLRDHAARVHAVGGISRLRPSTVIPGDVVVLSGRGGSDWTRERWAAVQAACPHRHFRHLGGETAVDDPLPYLAGARVVVAAAGQNSVADIAVAGTPAVILPQDRPFGEQRATAALLDAAGLALVRPRFPAPAEWPGLLDTAEALDSRWDRWQTAGAAQRAAAVIRKVAGQ